MVKYILFYKNMLINQMKQTVLEFNKILYFISLLTCLLNQKPKIETLVLTYYFISYRSATKVSGILTLYTLLKAVKLTLRICTF